MSVDKNSKLNSLLQTWPKNAVFATSWLNSQGYSNQLLNRYKESNWFQPLGTGAWIRTGDTPSYYGGLYALQKQLGLTLHPAARSAMSLLGRAHYLELSQVTVTLFCSPGETIPAWFKNHDWGVALHIHQSGFLPADMGYSTFEGKSFSFSVSSAERAMLECLYLAPKKQDLEECLQLMEGLVSLRPKILQDLLEACSSIKVKRLFLYLAEKCDHPWYKYLDTSKIDLGQGKRSLVKNGVYIPAYQITVPKILEPHEQPGL